MPSVAERVTTSATLVLGTAARAIIIKNNDIESKRSMLKSVIKINKKLASFTLTYTLIRNQNSYSQYETPTQFVLNAAPSFLSLYLQTT